MGIAGSVRCAVSILARPEGRALPTGDRPGDHCRQFQSSPVPKDGRYLAEVAIQRPVLVSILARPEGRALRPIRCARHSDRRFQSSPVPKDGRYICAREGAWSSTRFNPRPSRRTGATKRSRITYRGKRVSILARPEGRALPDAYGKFVPTIKFQSSPVPKDGRYRNSKPLPQ